MNIRRGFKTVFGGIASILGMGVKKNKLVHKEKGWNPTRSIHIGNPTCNSTKGKRYFIMKKARNRKRNKIAKQSRQVNRLAMG